MRLPGLTLTARDRRTLTLGVTVIGALLLGGRGLPAWRHWQRSSLALADGAALALAAQRAALVNQRTARDSLAARRKRLETLRSTWLDGDTPAAAGAALAGTISSVGERAGVTVNTLDIRVDSSFLQPFVPVRVHAIVVGDITGVANVLAGLEGGRLALSIRDLSIDATDAAALPNQPEVLRAELTVEAPWAKR